MLGHDDQGAVPGAATHANPDKYHQTSFNALAGYGAEGAQGRVEVEAGLINKRYDNFKLMRGKSRTTPSVIVMTPSSAPRSTGAWRPRPSCCFRPCRRNMTTSRVIPSPDMDNAGQHGPQVSGWRNLGSGSQDHGHLQGWSDQEGFQRRQPA
jgi:hypothetical protein